VCLVAAVQISAIGEKFSHAVWQWYKFKETSGGGYTTFSAEMFWMTVIFSSLGINASYLLLNHLDNDIGPKLTKLSGLMLSVGLVVLVTLILSPLGQFR